MRFMLDILPLAVLLFFMILFAVRGFLKSLVSFGKAFGAAIIALIFGSPVAHLIANRFLDAKIYNSVYSKLASLADNASEALSLADFFAGLREKFSWATGFGVNFDAIEEKYSNLTTVSDESLASISESISRPISKVASNVIGYIGVFLVALIGLVIVAFVVNGISDLIDKIPVVGSLNHFLGFVLGALTGLTVVVIMVFAIDCVCNLISATSSSFDYGAVVESTKVFKYLRNLNFVEYLKLR